MRILVEACGSLPCYANIRAIQEAGHVCVATDADEEAVGGYLADEFYRVPLASDEYYSEALFNLVIEKQIDLVIPTLDDGLLKWSKMRDKLCKNNVALALSSEDSLQVCLDKWLLYLKFEENNIETPKTSLEQRYELVKPRNGRGSEGVCCPENSVKMDGMISQEFLIGRECTIDVLCNSQNEPVYIVPRERSRVISGKSVNGVVIRNEKIDEGVRKICKAIPFVGPINIQCFITEGGVKFTEINPRFGGGSALGEAATENWIPLIVDTFINKKIVHPNVDVKYGLKMKRYYNEKFVY